MTKQKQLVFWPKVAALPFKLPQNARSINPGRAVFMASFNLEGRGGYSPPDLLHGWKNS